MSKLKYVINTAIKIPLPDFYQETNFSCGAAALLSLLRYYCNVPFQEQDVWKELSLKETGTDPYQIIKVVKKFGLKYKEYRKMTITQLKKCLDSEKPVMIMLQAWGKQQNYQSCKKDCEDGHWLIAIGYDKHNIYFEDPSMYKCKGYIKIKELDARWHDIESYSERDREVHYTDHYGIAIWKYKIAHKLCRVQEVP